MQRSRSRLVRPLLAAAFGLLISAAGASADPVYWADWTSATTGASGSAQGAITLPGPSSVSVSYSGQVLFAQTAGGTNFWNPATPYLSGLVSNAPPASDIVALVGGSSVLVNTIRFSAPVVDPLMAIVSLGAPSIVVTYGFDAPFDVISSGQGYWGGNPAGSLFEDSGNVLRGIEGHGVIQFKGTFTSISWTAPRSENWHGFTVGLLGDSVVPEPGSLTLLGLGLLGLAAGVRRRRRSAA